MRFGTKLFLGILVLAATVTGAVALASGRLFHDAFERESARTLAAARASATRALDDRTEEARLLLAPLQNDARIRAFLTEGQSGEKLDSFLNELPAGERELLVVISHDGHVLSAHSRGQPVDLDDGFLKRRQVEALFRGPPDRHRLRRMLWSGPRFAKKDGGPLPGIGDGVYLATLGELSYRLTGVAERELAGLAVVVQRLDLSFAGGADALFADLDQPIASTVDDPRVAAAAGRWLDQGAKTGAKGRAELLAGGADFYAEPLALQGFAAGPVRGALLFSRAAELDVLRTTRNRLGWLAALLLIEAAVVALLFARSVAKPVRALSVAAGRIAAGDLKVSVPEGRRDELGDLARAFNGMVTGLRERELAKEALGRYLSPEMATQLVGGGEGVHLDGERKNLTVLFSDVAGFTALSEALEPEQVVAFLNRYLDAMVPILFEQGAYIDKFEGDAIMAFWGAPIAAADHAVRGCLAALAMRDAVDRLRAAWTKEGLPALHVRWGLNSGDVVVGNMGSSTKVNYTAIGDEVNLASRLEGANKEYGTQLLVGEATREAALGACEFREVDFLRVKGKSKPARIYELLARQGQLGDGAARVREAYQAGLAAYRTRDFGAARARFEEALAASGGNDGPSRVFIERCTGYLVAPPPRDWDGAWFMTTK